MSTWLRWMAVFAGYAGWVIAVMVGLLLVSAATKLCPHEQMISGACTAPWFDKASTAIFCLSAAAAACVPAREGLRVL